MSETENIKLVIIRPTAILATEAVEPDSDLSEKNIDASIVCGEIDFENDIDIASIYAETAEESILKMSDNPLRQQPPPLPSQHTIEIPSSLISAVSTDNLVMNIPTALTLEQKNASIAGGKKVPKLIFVVPYRDRWEQYQFFDDHMRTRVLADYSPDDYLILYAHQVDDRDFNRGAMKNIGFLAGKAMFPDDYATITFVFNDVDTMPYVKNFLNYHTVPGNVKHFYGYHFALGGIVSICGCDFERINGFPNLFSWSSEDNALQLRVLGAGLHIDRSQFYPIMDKHILQNKDGLLKAVNRTEHERIRFGSKEGLSNLLSFPLNYEYMPETGFVNVTYFATGYEYNPTTNKVHNIANGTKVWADFYEPGYPQMFRTSKSRRHGNFKMLFGSMK